MVKNDRMTYIKSILSNLPELPGVYQYYDVTGTIIYVGKAKNLKKRVSQYFHGNNKNLKTELLVDKIYDIKYIIVDSEKDAFLLENNMIKRYQPRYNILLKDDKKYPWIVVKRESFPRVYLTRKKYNDGSVYFGPYTSSFQIKSLMEMIQLLYPIRTCSYDLSRESLDKKKYKVCLKYHIKKCCGPCERYISEDKYNEYISDIKYILKGNIKQVITNYTAQMQIYASELEFEKANEIKQIIEKLSSYQSKSTVLSSSVLDVCVFSVVADDNNDLFYVNFLNVANGLLIQSFTIEYKCKLKESVSEILSHAILDIRDKIQVKYKEIIVPVLPDVSFLGIKFTIPVNGDKKSLLELSERNVKQYKIDKITRGINNSPKSRDEKMLINIKESLNLDFLPRHIECFDNSNIMGQYPVAACVVFYDCRPMKSEYRYFNIKTVEGPDDYASMYEVVYRRYSRMISENKKLPDLIIADGGVGQMEIIRRVVEDDLNINIPILGLQKDNRHKTSEVLFGFPPKVVSLSKNDMLFKFFTRVQDEVHRVAISFHKNIRSKGMVKSELDGISGIGPKTKLLLLSKYKSVDVIRGLSIDELTNCIGKSKAKLLIEYFNSINSNKV